MTLVEVDDLEHHLSKGNLSFSIPGGIQNLNAEGTFVKEDTSGGYTWWATLTTHNGYVGVSRNNTGKFVGIKIDTSYYQIHPLSSRYNAMIKCKNIAFPDTACVTESQPSGPGDTCSLLTTCKSTVSILVLVTPEALNSLGFAPGSIDAALYIPFGLHSLNFALINSGLFGKSFKFIVEGYNFPFATIPFILDDLDILAQSPGITARRNATHADLVVLLTDSRYPQLGAWHSTASAVGIHGIVTIENLTGVRNVFAHEVGHGFWLNHTRFEENYFDHDICNFGYFFGDADFNFHKTIMGTLFNSDINDGIDHILNFSNPDVSYNGAATGTEYDANAFKLSLRMCIVQDYMSEEELEVLITGPSTGCNQVQTYAADILNEPSTGQPGSGPFTYSWSSSTNGFFNAQSGSFNPQPTYLGNTQTIEVLVESTMWLGLQVCGTGGVCANHVLKIVNCNGKLSTSVEYPTDKNINVETSKSFNISPNPAHDKITISLRGSQSMNGQINYTIQNQLGQSVKSASIQLADAGSFDIQLENLNFPPGVYFVSIESARISDTQPFILIK
jgi:hypothetical protein